MYACIVHAWRGTSRQGRARVPMAHWAGEIRPSSLHRHLSESQRAMVAANVATLKQRARTDLSPIGDKSQAEAASLLNVGKRSVERARQVKDKRLATKEHDDAVILQAMGTLLSAGLLHWGTPTCCPTLLEWLRPRTLPRRTLGLPPSTCLGGIRFPRPSWVTLPIHKHHW